RSAEVREVVADVKRAASQPAFNPMAGDLDPVLTQLSERHPGGETEQLLEAIGRATMSGAAAAPTLVRYTDPSPYPTQVLAAARAFAGRLLTEPPQGMRGVMLAPMVDPVTEMA